LTCSSSTRFGNLRFYLEYQNLVGQPTGVTEFTAYNNGGSGANAYMYKGTNDGTNHYMVDIPLPPDSATAVAQGTARVVGVGQIKEAKLDVKSAQDPRPEVTPRTLINVVARHTYADVVLSGPLQPRRQVVANEKCNVCHGALGTTTGSNTKSEAFHGGARNTVESCQLCHDPGRFSSSVMTNGLALSENYSFKRMIHGIHGNSKRTSPFTHDNEVVGAFGKDGLLGPAGGFVAGDASIAPLGTPAIPFATTTAVAPGTPLGPDVTNYAAEVFYPSVGLDCNGCHVNDSWRNDRGPIGAVVSKPLKGSATPLTVETDPLKWLVISPKAATCTACHDSITTMNHVIGTGGAAFGNASQAQSFQTLELCADCHAPGAPQGVDVVHGQK
jgi:OmcA/MtrC family decaheme c-type cytochrome